MPDRTGPKEASLTATAAASIVLCDLVGSWPTQMDSLAAYQHVILIDSCHDASSQSLWSLAGCRATQGRGVLPPPSLRQPGPPGSPNCHQS